MKNLDREKIEALNKRLKKKKYVSILLAFFTLGVNIFAWFAFSANVGLELDATVASWDVEFRDENEVLSKDVEVEVSKMKPGMDDFVKTITVETKSDVESSFSYEVTSFSLLGHTIDLTTKSDVTTYLKEFYPFSVRLIPSKVTLTKDDSITFDVSVIWPYEVTPTPYFAQDEVYSFNDSFIYYQQSSGSYSETEVTSSTYDSLKSSTYLEKDDADSYFGIECHKYEENSGKACLVLKLRMLVEQKNS